MVRRRFLESKSKGAAFSSRNDPSVVSRPGCIDEFSVFVLVNLKDNSSSITAVYRT